MTFSIREATPEDAGALHDLYYIHLDSPPDEAQDMAAWREKLARFAADPLYYVLVGETEGQIVSSVTLVVIESLLQNLRPYGVIEYVVTHADFRNRHYATALMNRACEIAESHNCYKIMLYTGSKQDKTLRFYENCGFDRNEKTAFIRRYT
ncbi:MAG: GNAT family N-acetyltransferase [Oscillospiraceae bacterium]|nr:GNAT family N-acetyltransferase [Oscillospiraceae bacterium]